MRIDAIVGATALILKTGLHSIRALADLAGLPEGAFAGAAALAQRIGAPRNYLGKLLQSMSHLGLVESRKGQGGGFRLARPAASITLLEILEPIEHTARWEGCLLGLPICTEENPCAVHQRWAHLREEYLSMLSDTSLADVARATGAHTDGRRAS